MLKIDSFESANEVRLVLFGRLSESWVSELKRVWTDQLRTLQDRKFVVDLREVTAIDTEGIELLSNMYLEGTKFLTAGVLIRHLVGSFRKMRKNRKIQERL
jgi:anti-anti-sigma regulatory factor